LDTALHPRSGQKLDKADEGETPMARRPRAPQLETRTARLKLAVRQRPYYAIIAPGISVGYRRNKRAGTWSVRARTGNRTDWIKRFGVADDFGDADGVNVFDWWQAIKQALKLARGTADEGRPVTVAEAIDGYERDLIARGADTANAKR